MTGKELFKKYTVRDYSGSDSDVYGQTLMTIWSNIFDDIYPLLEEAESQEKKLDITVEPANYLRDELLVKDIIFV